MIAILGAGESGVGAALLAQQQGYEIWVSDRGTISAKYKTILEKNGIPYEEGQHHMEHILKADEVVKSPGIPDRVPVIETITKKGIPVISEIEFASRFNTGRIIGITGSNGKTTTTGLTFHLLETAGLNVKVAGNIGPSFARRLTEDPAEYYVIELSSFQLDGIQNFRPQIAAILNLSPDHLDRYQYQEELYYQAKFRIAKNQTADDYLLLNKDDQSILNAWHTFPKDSQKIALGKESISDQQIRVDDWALKLDNPSLQGQHNAMNALFAIKIARLIGVDQNAVQQGLDSFKNAPHRMEMVETINGVAYINDSKATNIDAVFYALEAAKQPIIWIAGGVDKGNDYGQLAALVDEKVRIVIGIGKDNQKLQAAFEHKVQAFIEVESAQEAVAKAQAMAKEGETVLLSPACASFDRFKNYEDRGNQFKAAVHALNNLD